MIRKWRSQKELIPTPQSEVGETYIDNQVLILR